MHHNKFEFVIVLHPDEIKDFTKLLEDHCKKICSYWGCDFVHDGPTKTTLTVKLGFDLRRTLQDVERWLVSIFGNIADKNLSVKMVDAHSFARRLPDDYFIRRLRGKYGWYI